MMQWTPFVVKVMEHNRRIDRVNRTSSALDQITVTTSEHVPERMPSASHIVTTLTPYLRAAAGRRFPAGSH